MKDKTYIWILIAVAIICLGAGILIDRQFFAPRFVAVSVKFVPDSLEAGPYIVRADSLQGILEEVDDYVSIEERRAETWRERAESYRRLYERMMAAASDSTAVTPLPIKDDLAVLSVSIESPPDSSGRVYNDSLHVEYSKVRDVWQDIYLGLQKRAVMYLREVKETTVEQPYIPWYYWALTVVLVAATAIWG